MDSRNCETMSFKAFITTQFLGAFNDNAYKILITLLSYKILIDNPQAQTKFVSLVGGIFIIPFVLFSSFAGYLADRFNKKSVIVSVKILELLIMILGLFSILANNLIFMCIILFLMATQSALFSPSKYGILPEMIDKKELSKANGFLNMWSFVAIILGTAFGSQIIGLFKVEAYKASYFLVGISILGIFASLFIKKQNVELNHEKLNKNSFAQMRKYFGLIKKDNALFLTLLAIGYFYFVSSVVQMNIILFSKNILNLTDGQTGFLIVFVALGIGLGSFLAGKFSDNKIEFGMVPFGSIGMSVFCLALASLHITFFKALIFIMFLGFFAGFYIVPLNAFFQSRPPQENRGKYLAVLNIFTAGSILLGSVFIWFFSVKYAFTPSQLFLILGILSIFATAHIFKTLPQSFLRFVNWLTTHSIYKVQIYGQDNIPREGGALLVCNHVSFADPSIIMASIERDVRFLMYRKIYNLKMLNPLARIMKAIPISLTDSPKEIIKTLNTARDAVLNGELVCIFAEGALTKTGNMISFNRGFEKIMKEVSAPIIPIYIDAIWGSIFSFENDKFFWKWPKKAPNPVTISFGKPLPSNSKTFQVRLAVQELSAECFKLRGRYQEKLHVAFVNEAKKRPLKMCMVDSTGMKLNYIQALAMSILLSKKLFPNKNEKLNEMIGVMLPTSCMATLVNGAVLMSGKIPVNLNFTASRAALDSSIEQCGMSRIITSRKFLSKIKIEPNDKMIFLEDWAKTIKPKDVVIYSMISLLMPRQLIREIFIKGEKCNIDDIATVIFSSGSTGEPKGVMLTHGNVFSNIQGFYQVARIKQNDCVMSVLPFFHSFGFTACLCFPIGVGLSVVYHNNPLDAATIGQLVKKYKATIILGTPTFFSSYLKKCTKEQFSSIRYAVAGAEKLNQKLVDEFSEKLGVQLLEGYGATETAPIVSMSVANPSNVNESIKQYSNKEGKVGHPIPGVAVKVVDPETYDALDFDQDGLLLVKGPNVMKGYLNNIEKTNEVLKNGWYVTGDIASVDKDGFITITDRLSRFSKIGGEMVPHIKVEEKLLESLNTSELVVAVTALPDERKGEKLVVLHQIDINVDNITAKLSELGLPNLWIPKKENYFKVDSIPVLGSGKKDLKSIKQMAIEFEQSKRNN